MANLLKIKELAKQKNIQLKQLAELAGISEQGMHKILRQNSTTIETLERLAAILEVSPCVFFDGGSSTTSISGVNVTNEGGSQSVGNINNVKSHDEALAVLVAQLSKKDEQIDRLWMPLCA